MSNLMKNLEIIQSEIKKRTKVILQKHLNGEELDDKEKLHLLISNKLVENLEEEMEDSYKKVPKEYLKGLFRIDIPFYILIIAIGLFLFDVKLIIITVVYMLISFSFDLFGNVYSLAYYFITYPIVNSLLISAFFTSIFKMSGFSTFLLCLFLVPLLSVYIFLKNYKEPGFLKKMKVTLEITNIVYFCSFTLSAIYYFSHNSYNVLPISLNSFIHQLNVEPKDFIVFFIQIISVPFILSNTILKYLLELKEYNKKGNLI